MRIKAIVSGAAIAVAAIIGSASAADEFAILDGLPADVMSATALSSTVGADLTIGIEFDGLPAPPAVSPVVSVEVVDTTVNGTLELSWVRGVKVRTEVTLSKTFP